MIVECINLAFGIVVKHLTWVDSLIGNLYRKNKIFNLPTSLHCKQWNRRKSGILIPLVADSHWILFFIQGSICYMFDSFETAGVLDSHKDLFLKFIEQISGIHISNHVRMKVTQQSNGYDCGYFVIAIASQLQNQESRNLILQRKEVQITQQQISQVKESLLKVITENPFKK